MNLAQTQFGFTWGPADVERTSDVGDNVIISIKGKRQVAEVRVTPGGFVRVTVRRTRKSEHRP